ncbi:MAG: cell division protein FtsX [Sphingorhabdus sp.]
MALRRVPFAIAAHESKLIPDGRFSGAMPWVMAIMIFLTLLAAAAALSLGQALNQGGNELSRQATVQILEDDPGVRMAQQRRVAQALRAIDNIAEVRIVPQAEARALLEPWLGDIAEDAGVPVPALIDIAFTAPPSSDRMVELRRDLTRIAPTLRIDGNAGWLQPWFELMRTMLLIAAAVVLLLLLATAATVALSVRGALNTHRSTIEIMHMMGATDLQAARLFQRRVALDSLFGGMVGFVLAGSIILLLGNRFAALEPGLLKGAGVPIYGWLLLLVIPLAITGLSMSMARWTVLSTLKKML